MFISSQFKPAWWAKNRHLQTIFASLRQFPNMPVMQRHRLELADGDFIDVDLHLNKNKANKNNTKGNSTVLLLHGLEGSIDSHYIQALVTQLAAQGKQVAVMHFRSCSGELNRLPRCYHSGVSDDVQNVILLLAKMNVSIEYLVGFSLGGNVLLKWLGENHHNHQVKAAVAISVPLLLDECATAVGQGFSKNYAKKLLAALKQKIIQKQQLHPNFLGLTETEIKKLDSFWDFDHYVTAPLHHFDSAADYYQKSSSRQFLKSIEIPTLIIQAKDDPFMNDQIIPQPQELSAQVSFELCQHGGHVGFIEGQWPWKLESYLDKRIPQFLNAH